MPNHTLNLGHRGARAHAPENTPQAFSLAMEMGAHGVELDVHETDAGFVVVHDAPKAGVRGLPGLTDILADLSRFPGAVVFVEIKSLQSWPNLRAILDPQRGSLDLRPMSFSLEIVQQINGGYEKGIIADAPGDNPLQLLHEAGADLISLRHERIDAPLVRTLHDAGFEIHAWTVNQSAEMRRLLELGVDGIITDHPDRLRDEINRYAAP